jgi:ATP-dependent DNA helicase RecQ
MSCDLAAARSVLRAHFGYDDFRAGQVDVIASVLSRRDTLGVLPTGGGKSLCYQVPALVFPGLTIVISPLISLMKDQVDRLRQRGVSATLLNSTLGGGEVSRRLSDVALGKIKLLYVAPERFEALDLQRALRAQPIAMLAVDEAHCISEWGHDFRPSFRRIASVSRSLEISQTVALTATATPNVRMDIARQLGMRSPKVIVGGFDRTNLSYAVRRCGTDEDKDRTLLRELKTNTGAAVVYASTRATVERVAKLLTRGGVRAVPYHAGLDDAHRHEVQETFMSGTVDTIVATNAFGMGIDKPNVRLVMHYAMPGTLEAYYQEAGRAGRDGNPGRCVLLHAHKDRFTHEYFIRGMYPDRECVERAYAGIRTGHGPPKGRDGEAALRLLRQVGAVVDARANGAVVHIRLLATPIRIKRELCDPQASRRHPERREGSAPLDRDLLRALWRSAGESLYDGATVDLDRLPPGLAGRVARSALDRLRARQFVDVQSLDEGPQLARPHAGLADFHVDWDALSRRHANDMAKLDMMQGYAYTKNCRRAFVLRYFGEQRTAPRCAGCDNCSSLR